MKENTKQILKVCFCTLVALILFVGVILMCIYFAFDNSNDGVADAYYPKDDTSPVRYEIINYFDYVDVLDIEINEYIDNATAISQATKISFDDIFRPLILGDSRELAFPLYYVIDYAIGNEDGEGYGYTYGFTYTTAYSQTMNRFTISSSSYSSSRYCYSYDCYISFASDVPGQLSIDSLYITCYYTSDEYVYDAGYESGVIDTNENNQVIIDELQAQLDYYKTFYDASNWFNFIDSSYNNVKTAYFDGMKTTLKYTFDTGDSIGVALADDTGTAQGLIAYLDFGTIRAKDDLVRFSWKDLRIWAQSGSSGPGAFMPVHIAVLSDGSLIDCFVTTEDMMIDGSCEFTLPVSADGLYLYNSDASSFIFVSGMIGQYYSYDSELIYDNGFNAGYNDGRDDGIQYGEQVGYENGYADARDYYMNNDFSFFALISSVLDAPLQTIIGTDDKPGMLNFYIPGLDINIAPFLLSLFTVALVITVIRFILARAS